MLFAQWSLQDAKNKFSEVVNAADAGTPQIVTKRGIPAAVVLSIKEFLEYQQIIASNRPSFTDHLLAIPAENNDKNIDFECLNVKSRDFF